MPCPECLHQDLINETNKLNNLKIKFRREAKEMGLDSFAILKTVNDNPGYMWRPRDHEDIARLGAYEICISD
jgi:hypothetical protein